MREILSIAADIATIITAVCAAGFVIKMNLNVDSSTSKRASQNIRGNANEQNINQ